MATLKLSQIANAPSPPASSDTVVGVSGGNTDYQFSLSQIASTILSTIGITIGSTKINGGTNNKLLYDASGVVGEATVGSGLSLSGGTLTATGGGGGLTVGTTTVASGTSGYALTDNAGILGDTPIRTILTANTNYYVATTGSDANDGSLAHPWATLQHAAIFLAGNIDIAGFLVTVNIGAGSFTGFGTLSTIGGGIVNWIGAGPASTTITNGPNDGIINFGECFDINFISNTVWGIDQVTLNPTSSIAIASYAQGVDLTVGNAATFSGNITILFNDTSNILNCLGAGSITGVAATMTVNASGANPSPAILVEQNATLVDIGVWTITGNPTVAPWLSLKAAGLATAGGGSYSGAATGQRFTIFTNSGCSGAFPGNLGPNFFPGDTAGQVDASSAYDGFSGPLPGIDTQTGASYTLAISDAFEIVEMNNAGANTLTVPLNATAAFEIGTKIWITQIGAGATTIAGAVGVTVDNAGAVGGQWKSVKLYKRGTDEWVQTNA